MERKEEKGKKEDIWIQKRDLEILKFCLEMKFADIEILNQKFFNLADPKMFACRKRVQKLESLGYLRSALMLAGTTKKFYLTTTKGHRELLKASYSHDGPRPVSKLSVVTFEHDLGVLKARILLEKQNRAFNWRSERLLKAHAKAGTGRLQRDFMPDGIFTSKQGKICAFEFENKPKTEKQLREKIFRLKALMDHNDPVFEACLFITSTDALKKKIKTITDLFLNKFVVQSMGDLNAANEVH